MTNTANSPFNNITLKGNTKQQQYSGKNLLPLDQITNTPGTNGDTLTINENQEITLNGNSSTYKISLSNFTLPAGTYTFSTKYISGEKGGKAQAIAFCFDDKVVVSLEYTLENQSRTKTFDTDTTINQIMIWTTTANLVNYTIQLQIEQGSTATDYEPYVGGTASPNPDYPQDIKVVTGDNTITISNSDNTEKQELPISLGSLELCKIGDYQDYIYKKDNKWYKHQEIDKIQLLSSYNWKQYVGINYYTMSKRKYKYQNHLPCNCFNHVVCSLAGTDDNPMNNINIYDYQKDNSSTITLDELKTILDTKDVYVYLRLITPIEEEITDTTLISQLNELEKAVSYDDTTNISQTNANLPFIINAEAFKKIS